MDFKTGGRKIIERLVEAYGFTTRQALCDHLGVSKSTLATRYMRDIFPAEWVIQCELETGIKLSWLLTGEGNKYDNFESDIVLLPKKKIIEGDIFDAGTVTFDKILLPTDSKDLFLISDSNNFYIAEKNYKKVDDGTWLLKIENKFCIREIGLMPNSKVRIENGKFSFDCGIDELVFEAKAIAFTQFI